MTTKRIVFTHPNDGSDLAGMVCFISPAPNFIAKLMAATHGMIEDEAIAVVQAKDVPAGALNVCICDETELPTRTRKDGTPGKVQKVFRKSWKQDGASPPLVDMALARVETTDRIRPERDLRLAALDVEYFRAAETNDADAVAAVATKKQALRDLPVTIQPDIEAISDPVLLDDFTPVWP